MVHEEAAEPERTRDQYGQQRQAGNMCGVSDPHCVGKLLAWLRHRRPCCWMWDEFTRDHLEMARGHCEGD